jgi:toxin CcdB
LDVQRDLLNDLDSRMVIPVRSLRHFPKVKLSTQQTLIFTTEGEEYLLETPKMGAVPLRALKSPVTSLGQAQDQITAAMDFLFQGY